ncbi:MAG: hypothetical protein GF368_02560 [Candidatus Aenigmarchaeota archaeon]|nr:hypothetical protein [Candidatus Aenigmarchaeota archaeon]
MSLRRISTIIRRDIEIMLNLKWKMVETFYFPATMTVIWGFFILWSQEMAFEGAFVLLTVNMFWSFAYQSQSGTNQQIMEDRWTETFRQVVTTPLKAHEYLIGKSFIGVLFSLLSFIFVIVIAYVFFDYTLFLNNWVYFLVFVSIVLITSTAISILVSSLITILGNEYAFISWTTTQLFILFSAPFFPVEVYPFVIRKISEFIPYTWVFESIRMLVDSGYVLPSMLSRGLVLSLVFLGISIPVYSKSYKLARKNGRLVKIW